MTRMNNNNKNKKKNDKNYVTKSNEDDALK